jgi:Ca-activated chloride channel family protein
MLLMLSPIVLSAQNGNETTRILFLLDASRSMSDRWGDGTKMVAARSIISNLVDTLSKVENLEMGLRIYGHQSVQSANDCKDSRLEVGFREGNTTAIKRRLQEIRPKGITPISYSLSQSANDFPDADSRNIIIMITDGVESCDRDPCYEIEQLRNKNVLLRAFVIGLAVEKELHRDFDCIGEFFNASSQDDLSTVMDRALRKVLNRTVVRVDLLDAYGRPTETDVNMSFFGLPNGRATYNYYHTINDRGEPDTLYVEPILDYDLRVHTIPPVELKNIQIEPNRYNVFELDAGTGKLRLGTSGNKFTYRIQALVYPAGSRKTIHVQDFNSELRYLNGIYDLEILTLPRIRVRDIEIKQDHSTTFEIPAPGYITFVHSYELVGSVFTWVDDELVEIYQLSNLPRNETIALQPGKYRVVYRSKVSKSMRSSLVKDFEIAPGSSSSLKL